MVCLLPYEPAFEALLLQWIPAFFGYHQSLTGGEGLENGAALLQAEENLQEWQQPPSSLYIILEDKQAAGFIRLYRRGDTVIWIEDIFVEAASRGRGIASAAIQAAEKIAAKTPGCLYGCRPRNENALQLYHRLGYRDLSLLTLRKELGKAAGIARCTCWG